MASRRRAPERRSSDVTDPAARVRDPEPPPANEIRSGSAPAANLRRTRRSPLVEPVDDAVRDDRRPDEPAADSHVADGCMQVGPRQHAARLRIELPEDAVILERPQRAFAERQPAAAVVREVTAGGAVLGHDPRHLALARDPERVVAAASPEDGEPPGRNRSSRPVAIEMRASSGPPSCAAQTKPSPAASRPQRKPRQPTDLVSSCVRVSMRKSRCSLGSSSHAERPATTTSEGASPQPNFVPERRLASAAPVVASTALSTSGCSAAVFAGGASSRKASTVPTAPRPRPRARRRSAGDPPAQTAATAPTRPCMRVARCGGEITTARVTLLRLLGERACDHAVPRRPANPGRTLGDPRRRLVQMGEDHGKLVLALERPLTRHALEQHAAECVDVGAAVDLLAANLLRRNVVDGADETPIAGQAADGATTCRARPKSQTYACSPSGPLRPGRCRASRRGGRARPRARRRAPRPPVPRARRRARARAGLRGAAARADRRRRRSPSRGRARHRPRPTAIVFTTFGWSSVAATATRAGSAAGTDRRARSSGDEQLQRDPPAVRVLGDVDGAHRAAGQQLADPKASDDPAGRTLHPHRACEASHRRGRTSTARTACAALVALRLPSDDERTSL